MSGIKFVRVDTANNTVRVGGGNLWGEVDHATHPFGLAVPAGIISTTGVGGLTLGWWCWPFITQIWTYY